MALHDERPGPVRVAVGCSFGKHRSVTIVVELEARLKGIRSASGRRVKVVVQHREQHRWTKAALPWRKEGRRGLKCSRERQHRSGEEIEAEWSDPEVGEAP